MEAIRTESARGSREDTHIPIPEGQGSDCEPILLSHATTLQIVHNMVQLTMK
jgi:hypothetical protein